MTKIIVNPALAARKSASVKPVPAVSTSTDVCISRVEAPRGILHLSVAGDITDDDTALIKSLFENAEVHVTNPPEATSVSKAKGKKNARSVFLSEFMKRSAGDAGNAMAEAFAGGDVDKFKSAFMKMQHDLVLTMQK